MRIDVPTLRCDRCGETAQDESVMARFITLRGQWDEYQGTKQRWDLCRHCFELFEDWILTP